MKFEETITYMVYIDMLKTLEAVRTANKTAYTSNTYWKMGFDAAYDSITYRMEQERKTGEKIDEVIDAIVNGQGVNINE